MGSLRRGSPRSSKQVGVHAFGLEAAREDDRVWLQEASIMGTNFAATGIEAQSRAVSPLSYDIFFASVRPCPTVHCFTEWRSSDANVSATKAESPGKLGHCDYRVDLIGR